MKRRMVALFLVLTLALSAMACGGSKESSNRPAKREASTNGTIVDNMYLSKDGKVLFKTPADYKTMDSTAGELVVHKDYPTTTDNINVTSEKSGAKFEDFKKEDLEKVYASMFDEVKTNVFEKVKVDGNDAYKVGFQIKYSGIAMTMYQYIINADSIYTVTYTDVTGGLKGIMENAEKDIFIYK